MNHLKPYKLKLPYFLTLLLLTALSCHVLFLFLNYRFTHLFAPVIAQIFNPIAEILIPIAIQSKESNAEIETHPLIAKAKMKKVFHVIYNYRNFFVVIIHQFILVYFVIEIILYFFYIFQSKFLTYVFLSHI